MSKIMLSRRDFVRLTSFSLAGAATGFGLTACGGSSSNPSNNINRSSNDFPLPFNDKPLPQHDSLWLNGNYAPVDEEVVAKQFVVTGTIPADLTGMYIRNGSNEEDTIHSFMGNGMLHGVKFEEGVALEYRNKYIDISMYRNPGFGRLQAILSGATQREIMEAHQSNISIFSHAGHLLTSGEVGLPYEVNPEDLSTIGSYTFNDELLNEMTAHPKIDERTGEMFFFGYSVVSSPHLRYYRVNPEGSIVHQADIDLPAPVSIHDFAITEDYVLFFDLPLEFDLPSAISGANYPFAWNDDLVRRIGVMPKDGGNDDIQWFEFNDPDTRDFIIFHTMNAYQDPSNGEVVLHAMRIEGKFWQGDDRSFNNFEPKLHEWRFNLALGEVTRDQAVNNRSGEFPVTNRYYTGYPYRYGYNVDYDLSLGTTPLPQDLVKHDFDTGETLVLNFPAHLQPDEAFFVSKANPRSEDDGYLLTYVFDKERNLTDLMIIDASNFLDGAIARVHLPYRVPHGFHGVWYPTI